MGLQLGAGGLIDGVPQVEFTPAQTHTISGSVYPIQRGDSPTSHTGRGKSSGIHG